MAMNNVCINAESLKRRAITVGDDSSRCRRTGNVVLKKTIEFEALLAVCQTRYSEQILQQNN